MSVGIQDFVLLEKRKENKLSPHYEKEPYQVTARHGDQVQLKSPLPLKFKCSPPLLSPL